MPDAISSHLRDNYAAFQDQLPAIIEAHRGQYALMRDSQIVQFYDTPRDAFLVGQQNYADGRFSVQEVIDTPVDLGFFSHALSQG
jgi:hypothetical protein